MKKIIFLCFFVSSIFASTTIDGGSFNNIADAFTSWVQGSLGYIIALLGVIGSLAWYMIGEGVMGGSQKALFVGIMISFFAGGLVGIVLEMMNIGKNTFN